MIGCSILLLMLTTSLRAAPHRAIRLDGPSNDVLTPYYAAWVDRSDSAAPLTALHGLEAGALQFHGSAIVCEDNAHPLWLHLLAENRSAKAGEYWWACYDAVDTITVYLRTAGGWIAYDTLAYGQALSERKIKARFLATRLSVPASGTLEVLFRIRNLRNSRRVLTDITTGEDNLAWERDYYGILGLNIGCFLIVSIISLVLFAFTKSKVFLWYFATILLVITIAGKEESLITAWCPSWLKQVTDRIHTLPLIIAAACFHFKVVRVLGAGPVRYPKPARILDRLVDSCMLYGAGFLIVTLAVPAFDFRSGAFVVCWYLSGLAIVLVLIATLGITVLSTGQSLLAYYSRIGVLIVLLLSVFLNLATYAGLKPELGLVQANVAYLCLFLEIILIGGITAWQYQQVLRNNYELVLQQQIAEKSRFEFEIEVQQKERLSIAGDLHDDLGATLSAINLIITNFYKADHTLVGMISKAANDLRIFTSNLLPIDFSRQHLFEVIAGKVADLNYIRAIAYEFTGTGDPAVLDQHQSLAIFRMVMELLNNIAKHSRAANATVLIAISDFELSILASDDGAGFDPERQRTGMGLGNLRKRTEALKGSLQISSGAAGTSVRISIPLRP